MLVTRAATAQLLLHLVTKRFRRRSLSRFEGRGWLEKFFLKQGVVRIMASSNARARSTKMLWSKLPFTEPGDGRVRRTVRK